MAHDTMEEEIETQEEAKRRLPGYTKAAIAITIAAVIGVGYITTTRQPGIGGPITVLVFLALIFLGCIGVFLVIAELLFRAFKRQRFSSLRLFYTSVLAALGVVFLIGLQTLGQLQLIDVVLIIIFELLLNFYLLRRF